MGFVTNLLWIVFYDMASTGYVDCEKFFFFAMGGRIQSCRTNLTHSPRKKKWSLQSCSSSRLFSLPEKNVSSGLRSFCVLNTSCYLFGCVYVLVCVFVYLYACFLCVFVHLFVCVFVWYGGVWANFYFISAAARYFKATLLKNTNTHILYILPKETNNKSFLNGY